MSDETIEEAQVSVSIASEEPLYVAAVETDNGETGIFLQIWETEDEQFVVIASQGDEMIPVDLVDSLDEGISRVRTVLESLGAESN
jgi:hypothetical protein